MSEESTVNGEQTMGEVSADRSSPAAPGAASTLRQDLDSSSGGYEMVFAGVIFALAGLWLDRQLGWTPILTIVLAILGFVGGVLGVYYRYKRDIERIEAETAALRGRTS
ncbi:MAG: AtpZ/AtpI family protein [Actinomycetota bacterium]